MIDEPIRGGFPPDPSFYAQPGIDQLRAWMRGLTPRAPLSHLTGYRLTHVGSGSATLSLRASPWLQNLDGSLELRIPVETALYSAALAGAPASHEVRTAAFSLNHLRWCTLESEALVVRAKTVNMGRSFTVTEVQVEDALGRAVATATGVVVVQPRDPPPPPLLQPLQPVVSPSYPTPDPPARPLPTEVFPFGIWDEFDGLTVLSQMAKGELPHPPISELMGVRFIDVAKGTSTATLRTSLWHCINDAHDVSPGVIAFLAQAGLGGALLTLCPPGHRLGIVAASMSFVRPVAPDGRELLARGTVLHEGGRFLVAGVEVIDSEGNRVALGQQTSLLVPKRPRPHGDTEPERLLATVLFTDIVGSTRRAEELGDAGWQELLDEHHALVRKQLQVFRGREVKTTGDGFLATFDSPSRAVQCARAIRDGLRHLGLEVRAGLHTGECEISGADVAGIAVHIASRIQGLAVPSEILVSGTVHDLVTGSGLRFSDHGRHQLKGIEGDWSLFAAEN